MKAVWQYKKESSYGSFKTFIDHFSSGGFSMAHRRSKKKTYSQQIVGLAATTMPPPIQRIATSRWGARILLFLAPVLVATGVVHFSIKGGLPQIFVSKERAAAVGQELEQDAVRAAATMREEEKKRWR